MSKQVLGRWLGRNRRKVGILAVALVVLLLIGRFTVARVPDGHIGVLWSRLGGPGIYCGCILPRGTALDEEELRDEGLSIKLPWDVLFFYDLRLQTIEDVFQILLKDGVYAKVSIQIRLVLSRASASTVHKFVGPAYVETMVAPATDRALREIMSTYDFESLRSVQGPEMNLKILPAVQTELGRSLDEIALELDNDQADRLKNSIRIFDTTIVGIKRDAPVLQ